MAVLLERTLAQKSAQQPPIFVVQSTPPNQKRNCFVLKKKRGYIENIEGRAHPTRLSS
jgi:hypothetical protein